MKTTYEATKKAAELLKGLNEGTQSYILLKTIIGGPKTVEQLAERIKSDDKTDDKTGGTPHQTPAIKVILPFCNLFRVFIFES